jgi:hypothetical protein
MGCSSSRKETPMPRRNEDDDDDAAADDAKDRDDAPVVPEAGEGPYPPLTGRPIPPIGN